MTTQLKVKTADTARASTTTQTDDPHLVVSLEAGATYLVSGQCWYAAGATPNIKLGLKSTSTLTWAAVRESVHNQSVVGNNFGGGSGSSRKSATEINAGSAMAISGNDTAGTRGVYRFDGMIVNGGTAGELSVFWAQNTSSATDASLLKGSFIRLQKVSASRDQVLIKQTTELRSTTPGAYEDDGELVGFSLTAGRVYWIDIGILGNCVYAFANRLYANLTFSGTINADSLLLFQSQWPIYTNEWDSGSGYGATYFRQTFDVAWDYSSLGDNSNNTRGFARHSGILRVNGAGDIKLGWYHAGGGGYSAGVGAGSYFVAIDITEGILG